MNSADMRETVTYIWSNNSRLGGGTFGEVYKGKHKNTTEEVAVKCFKVSQQGTNDECEKVKLIIGKKHRNIVSLIAVEAELAHNNNVLVMELCLGSNLHEILQLPDNKNGLENSEFLLVLKDLKNAVCFLRENKIVHRDIKPGNIMRKIDIRGKKVYKLTDFGTVCSFVDERTFSTQCGTHSYMDPNCIGKFMPGISSEHDIVDANIDLWSIGVTLYESATGSLPFIFKDLRTLYNVTTKKRFGVISVAFNANGTLNEFTLLPNTCRLDAVVNALLTRLLAGLMETKWQYKLSYEKFFNSVDLFLSAVLPLESCESTNSDFQDIHVSSETAHLKGTGIDFGTAYCSIGQFENDEICSTNKTEVQFPSYLACVDGEVLFWDKAKRNFRDDPKYTFYNLKAAGWDRSWRDSHYEYEYREFYFGCFPLANIKELRSIRFLKFRDESLCLEESIALFIANLKLQLETDFLDGQTAQSVTISVPLFFNDSKRKVIYDAATIAGFNNVTLLSDTVATTLDYLFVEMKKGIKIATLNEKLLVFSMGAGFTSVSVIEIKNGCVEVLENNGCELGGNKFDSYLCEFVLKELFPDEKLTAAQLYNIRLKCEKARIALSKTEETIVEVQKDFGGETFKLSIRRRKFEEICSRLFIELFTVFEDTLKKANVALRDLKAVIYTGGPTRMNKIVSHFRRVTVGQCELIEMSNAAVLCGCCFHSAMNSCDELKIKVSERSIFSYTLECKNNAPLIIKRGSILPVSIEGTMKIEDSQEASKGMNFVLSISEGDQRRGLYFDCLNIEASDIGDMNVKIMLDENGLLSLTAVNIVSQKEYSLLRTGFLTQELVKKSKQYFESIAEEAKRTTQWLLLKSENIFARFEKASEETGNYK